MLKKNKIMLSAAVGVIILWFVLYSVLISPKWQERDDVKKEADDQLERWVKLYDKGKDDSTQTFPSANKKLDAEEAQLKESLDKLTRIEFAREMKGFTMDDVGLGDPNNYFDRKRKEAVTFITKQLKLGMVPGLDDLGFRGKHNKDPVPLNLVRLFMLRRFAQAAGKAGIKELLSLEYPDPRLTGEAEEGVGVPVDEEKKESKPKLERLFQVPLLVRVRSPERDFAQFLAELQRPSDEDVSYFCLRGFIVAVKEENKGVVDSEVAVAGLFPEKQYLEVLKIPFEEKKTLSPYSQRPALDPGRY